MSASRYAQGMDSFLKVRNAFRSSGLEPLPSPAVPGPGPLLRGPVLTHCQLEATEIFSAFVFPHFSRL